MSKSTPSVNVSVTFRHTESTPALKSYAEEKIVGCVEKYISHHADVHVVLSVEKRDHIAEIHLTSKGYDVTAKAVTEDLYSAIDKVTDNIDAQVRKKKERMTDHKHQGAPQVT